MIPYYDEGGVAIYHADNREVVSSLVDVGLFVTSPPYNLSGEGTREHSFSHGGKRNATAAGSHFSSLAGGYETERDDLPHGQYVAEQRALLRACWQALAPDGAIYYVHKPRVGGRAVWLPLELVPDDLPVRQVIVWDRGSGFNRQLTYFVPRYEWVLLVARDGFRLNTRSIDDVWRIAPDIGNEHPAPFPLGLPMRAIDSCDAGLVVDPFAGSGTTLVAAKACGRRAIGIEKSERYCEMAARRLAQEALNLGGV